MKKTQCGRFVFCLLFFLTAIFCYGGCRIFSIIATPGSHEKKIPAEYGLAEHRKQKILVLVNQPVWLGARANLRYYLTEVINENLTAKVKIPSRNLIAYRELSQFRSDHADFSLLSPAKVGTALAADLVLLVVFEDYQLHEVAQTRYYKGALSARVILLDVATGETLWPESAQSKSIRVGFEVETRGHEAAVGRLVKACARCIVRYLYDCPKIKFKVFDDKSNIGWDSG
ncbi:MAG: hypothetical protein ACYSWR_02110 [Planctomycetota bacterium]|jgi:hypothetical protein